MLNRFVLSLITITLSITFSYNAFASSFLPGVQAVNEKEFEKAITYFLEVKSSVSPKDWRQLAKLNIWLGFSFLAVGRDFETAKPLFLQALCTSLPEKYSAELDCEGYSSLSKGDLSDYEVDRLLAALSAIATHTWYAKNYEDSLAYATLANTILVDSDNNISAIDHNSIRKTAKSERTGNAITLDKRGTIDYSKFNSAQDLLTALNKRAQLGNEKIGAAILSHAQKGKEFEGKSIAKNTDLMSIAKKTTVIQSYMSVRCVPGASIDMLLEKENIKQGLGDDAEEFIFHVNRIVNEESGKENCNSDSILAANKADKRGSPETREIARKEKREKRELSKMERHQDKYFLRFAGTLMCRGKSLPQISNFETLIDGERRWAGSTMEANRGNELSNSILARPSVLKQLRLYFDSLNRYSDLPPPGRDHKNFRSHVSKCAQPPGLNNELQLALVSAMKRRQYGESYYLEVIDTLSKSYATSKVKPSGYGLGNALVHAFLAERLEQLGSIDQSIQQYRTAITRMTYAPNVLQTMGMSDMARALAKFANLLKKQNQPVKEVYDAVNILVEKHKAVLRRTPSVALLDEDQFNNDRINSVMGSVNGIMDTAIASKLPAIPEDGAEKFEKLFGQASSNLNSKEMQAKMAEILSQSPSKKSNEKAASGDLSEIFTNVNEQITNSSFGADVGGTVVEYQRDQINENRLFNLGIARVMLAMEDLEGAKKWILSPHNLGESLPEQLDAVYYRDRTLSFDAYVKAVYYQKINQPINAKSNYALAIKHWYFSPHSPLELLFGIYDTPSSLLEEVINFELTQGNEQAAFYYAELARHSFLDSDRLYARLNNTELALLKSTLEDRFQMLIETAGKNANARGENKAFLVAKQDSEARLEKSKRDEITPLEPLYTALVPFLPWVNDLELHGWLGALDKFSAAWEFNKVYESRQNFLTDTKNASVASTWSPSGGSGKIDQQENSLFGDDSPFSDDEDFFSSEISDQAEFRSAVDSKDSIVPAFSINQRKSHAYLTATRYTELRNRIADDETILSYWISPEFTYAFAANKSNLYSKVIPTERLIAPIKKLTGSNYDSAFDAVAAKQLYDLLIIPFKNKLNKNITLIVNGPLQNLAFSSLIEPDSETYFGDIHLIRHHLSVDDIYRKKPQHEAKKNQLLLLAPGNVQGQESLTSYIVEAESISKIYDSRVFFDQAVTRTLFEKELPRYKMAHFAGHASLDTALPDFSRLVLAENSSFYVRDIVSMDLSGLDLIVLSACETGSTTEFNLNNEFSALNSAFLKAGAGSVVSTLRKVKDDIASRMMASFYKELGKGLRKDVALQRAQNHMRNEGIDAADWSAFILSGSYEPIEMN